MLPHDVCISVTDHALVRYNERVDQGASRADIRRQIRRSFQLNRNNRRRMRKDLRKRGLDSVYSSSAYRIVALAPRNHIVFVLELPEKGLLRLITCWKTDALWSVF